MNSFVEHLLKTKIVSDGIGLIISRASFLVPGIRLRENSSWIAIVHPKPAYPIHIVVLPKRKIKNWMSLPLDDAPFYNEFVNITQSMIRDFCLDEAGYRLIVNGGPNQTFPHLHIHLIAGNPY